MLYRSSLIIVIIIFLFSDISFAVPGIHFGNAPAWVISVKANDQQANLRDVNDGYYLKLFEEEVNVDKVETYHHTVKEIVSDAGVQSASDLSIDFNPAYQQLTIHQVTVWRDGKPLDKLQKEAFKVIADEEDLSMFIYNGNYKAYLILKDIRKGDEIECAYTITGRNPVFNGKFFTSFSFQGVDHIAQIHYCLIASASRTLSFKYFNNAGKPVVNNPGNTVCYDWDLLNIKGVQYNNNSPAWFDPYPYVQISEYKDWSEVADWAYKINMPEDKLKGTLGKRVAKLKEQYGADSAALFRAIVSVVQNEVRYMGVEMGSYSHKANNPEKVYEQRYGDCKDKSLLLVSMLHSAGINAEMALVNSENKYKIEDDLPMPASFNHAIVLAHVSGKDVWVDPTIAGQGNTGTDIFFPYYGKALVLAKGTNSLMSIPETPYGETKYTEEYEVTDVKDPVSLTVRTIYSAGAADDIRSALADQGNSDLEKKYLDYYSKIYPNIESADTIVINDDKKADIFEVIERYTITDFFEFDSSAHSYSVNFFASMVRNQLPVVGKIKDCPLALNYPYSLDYSVHVNAAINWQIEQRTENISRGGYRYSYDVSTNGNTLSLEHKFIALKDNIAPGEIAQYEKDRKKIINDYLSFTFTYSTGETTARSGTNFWSIFVFIILVAGCVYTFFRIYKKKTAPYVSAYYQPRAIGGWLVLPHLGLIASACQLLYLIFNGGFFTNSLWHTYDAYALAFKFKALLWQEFIGNTVTLCFTLFCLVLFFKKRDILPRCVSILYIGSMILVILDSIEGRLLFSSSTISHNNILRSVLAVAIWVPYFSRSVRVKETFTIPYPKTGYHFPDEPMTMPHDVTDAAEIINTPDAD